MKIKWFKVKPYLQYKSHVFRNAMFQIKIIDRIHIGVVNCNQHAILHALVQNIYFLSIIDCTFMTPSTIHLPSWDIKGQISRHLWQVKALFSLYWNEMLFSSAIITLKKLAFSQVPNHNLNTRRSLWKLEI